MNKNRRIYRQVALERLSSPEQLDHILRVTSPRNWAGLLAIYVLFCAAIVWGSITKLPLVARGAGVIVECTAGTGTTAKAECSTAPKHPQSGQPDTLQPQLRVYVPALEAQAIKTGETVQFRPLNPAWNGSAFIQGKVVSISETPFTLSKLAQSLESEPLARSLMEHGPVMELRAVFTNVQTGQSSDPTSESNVPLAALVPGTTGEVKLVVGTQKPISMLFSAAKTKFGR